ncbi:MAG: TIM barrel protein, partial [Verrucomicrobia bacterium]|nr:TIM barrel protein [Verrucomicrobiota bacterium]
MTYSMLLSRRDFLRAAAAASAAGLSRTLQAAGPRGRKPSIGLQLYAVRGEFARDVPGALQTVARIGYQGVEFWGYGGEPKVFRDYAAEDLRKLLDKTGLKCCGMHLQLRAIQGDRLQRTVRVNQLLGNRRLIVAAAEAYMRSEKKIAELAALLNETAARLRPRGMRIGYHAHPFDFRKIGDACA